MYIMGQCPWPSMTTWSYWVIVLDLIWPHGPIASMSHACLCVQTTAGREILWPQLIGPVETASFWTKPNLIHNRNPHHSLVPPEKDGNRLCRTQTEKKTNIFYFYQFKPSLLMVMNVHVPFFITQSLGIKCRPLMSPKRSYDIYYM